MKVDVRSKVCKTCPWLRTNAHQLTCDVIDDMVKKEIISACHQEQAKTEGCTTTEGVELYAQDCQDNNETFKVCRGFAIARAREMIIPNNHMIGILDAKMREEDDYHRDDIVDMKYVRSRL